METFVFYGSHPKINTPKTRMVMESGLNMVLLQNSLILVMQIVLTVYAGNSEISYTPTKVGM